MPRTSASIHIDADDELAVDADLHHTTRRAPRR